MRVLRRKPSPALVIAVLALFVSLGGTSFAAATFISGKQIKPHTIAKNRLTNKAVKQLKGNIGPAGPAGPSGPSGPSGPAGAAGSAIAYAHVNANGSLDTAHSKNVSASNLTVATGDYCLTVTVPVSNATGTVDAGNNGGYFGYASVVLAGQDPNNFIGIYCPPGSNVLVGIFSYNGTNQDYSFWLSFN